MIPRVDDTLSNMRTALDLNDLKNALKNDPKCLDFLETKFGKKYVEGVILKHLDGYFAEAIDFGGSPYSATYNDVPQQRRSSLTGVSTVRSGRMISA